MRRILLLLVLLAVGVPLVSGFFDGFGEIVRPNAILSISSATTTEVVAARPGRQIRVWQFQLQNKHATTDCDITFKSASTGIDAVFTLKAATGGYHESYSSLAYFTTAPGEALNITTSAACTLVGRVQYSID